MASNSSPRRAAIITGAAQGLGRAIALQLAQDGYDIAVNDLQSNVSALQSLVEEIQGKGRKAIALIGDVTKESDVQTFVDRTVAELGELYIMVANAGIGTIGQDLVELTLDAWDRMISINLTGVFLCYRAAARQMLKQGHGGRIIGASSFYGKRGHAGAASYCAAKFGVRGLTQALASELAPEGITVNAYAPGYMDTPLLSGIDKAVATAEGKPPGSWYQSVKEKTPVGRLGTAEDVAGLVSYLVSDAASFVTGQSVSVNGGTFYD